MIRENQFFLYVCQHGSHNLTRPDDWHLHLRDGEALKSVLADTARRFARAIIMPT